MSMLQSKHNTFVRYNAQSSLMQLTVNRKFYQVKATESVYHGVMQIVNQCAHPQSIESLYETVQLTPEEIQKWINVLLQVNSIYLLNKKKFNISESLKQYITMNFTDHDERLEKLGSLKVALVDDYEVPSSIRDYFQEHGISCLAAIDYADWVIVSVDNVSLIQACLQNGSKVLVIKRVGDAYGLLALKDFDQSTLDQFIQYPLEGRFYSALAVAIIGQNVLFHILEHEIRSNALNTRIIRADGVVNHFEIGESMATVALPYHRRLVSAPATKLEQVVAFEQLQGNMPHLFKNGNQKVKYPKQSPIACYEVTLHRGEQVYTSVGFHQDYLDAAERAISSGLSGFLNYLQEKQATSKLHGDDSTPELSEEKGVWICKSDEQSFQLAGLISALRPYAYQDVVPVLLNEQAASLRNYCKKHFYLDLKVHYQSVIGTDVGRILLLNAKTQDIMWQSQVTYALEDAILDGLYTLIGYAQNTEVHQIEDYRLHDFGVTNGGEFQNGNGDSVALEPKDMESVKAVVLDRLFENGILVKEEPWVYQDAIAPAGFFVGRFSKVV